MTATKDLWSNKAHKELERDWEGASRPTLAEKCLLSMEIIHLDYEIAQHLELFADIQAILKRSDISNEDKLGFIREICDEGLDSIQQ